MGATMLIGPLLRKLWLELTEWMDKIAIPTNADWVKEIVIRMMIA